MENCCSIPEEESIYDNSSLFSHSLTHLQIGDDDDPNISPHADAGSAVLTHANPDLCKSSLNLKDVVVKNRIKIRALGKVIRERIPYKINIINLSLNL